MLGNDVLIYLSLLDFSKIYFFLIYNSLLTTMTNNNPDSTLFQVHIWAVEERGGLLNVHPRTIHVPYSIFC